MAKLSVLHISSASFITLQRYILACVYMLFNPFTSSHCLCLHNEYVRQNQQFVKVSQRKQTSSCWLSHLLVQTALAPAMHKLAVIAMALTPREKLISDLQSVLLFRCVAAMFYRMSCLFLSIPKSYIRQEINAGFVKQIKHYDAGGTSDDQGNLSLLVGKRSHSS